MAQRAGTFQTELFEEARLRYLRLTGSVEEHEGGGPPGE